MLMHTRHKTTKHNSMQHNTMQKQPNTTQHTTQTPSSQPLTWQHGIKSLLHREQIDDSTVCEVHSGDIEIFNNCLTALLM